MKKLRSVATLLSMTLVIASISSCDEQNESAKKPEAKSSGISIPNGRVANFDGTEGDPLDLATAKQWTANFRSTLENANETQAHYFGNEIIQQVLGQVNCVGVRIYYALDDDGEKKLLIVGVDSKGENILSTVGGRTSDGGGVVDFSYPCPTYCPSNGL